MVIEKQIDELTIEKWRFYFLDAYYLLQKESKRHKNFKILKKYERLDSRNNTLTENEVPFTDDLKQEVINNFVSKIKVLKWSER